VHGVIKSKRKGRWCLLKKFQKNVGYKIEATTYTYKDTGNLDEKGKKVWKKQGEPTKRVVEETNFRDLKRNLYDESKKDKSIFVDYAEPVYEIRKKSRQLRSVTKMFSNGTKQVTYYAPKGKCEKCNSSDELYDELF